MKFLMTFIAVFAWRLFADKVLGMPNNLAFVIGVFVGTAVFVGISILESGDA